MTSRVPLERWIRRPAGSPRPGQARLVCFPYAGGGGGVFHPWGSVCPPALDLCAVVLPGREARLAEEPVEELLPLVRTLATVLAPVLLPPFALYGHSLGAVLAYELARELGRSGRPLPSALFVSGRNAPHLADPRPRLHRLPRKEFVEEIVRRYNGIPEAILAEPELLDLLLPALRADVAMIERYVHEPGESLGVPIHVFGGLSDPSTTRVGLEAWRELAGGRFTLRLLPGDHFFLQTARAELLSAIGETLALAIAPALALVPGPPRG